MARPMSQARPEAGVQADGQPEHDERDHLGQAGQRGAEAGDLAFVGGALVAEEDARDEHGQEAGPVGDRGQAVDRQRAGEDAQRVQALRWAAGAAA